MTSMAYNSAAGLAGMLKEGTRHFSQEDDPTNSSVVLRNISACLELSRMLSTSLGPQGRCKLVVNHLEKIMVTSDCAAILKEVEVEHPAAKLLASACRKQEEECGDNTNFVLAFAGELLWQTAQLIAKMTWQPAPEILAGYRRALDLCESKFFPTLVCDSVNNFTQKDQLLQLLRPVLASKQYGSEGVLAPLVVEACLRVMKNGRVSVESVRTVKIPGASVSQSVLLDGYAAKSGVETVVTSVEKAKIAVFASGFEASSTEAKGTVLMKTADDLKNYNKSEEAKMEEIVRSIVESGVKIVVTGGNLSDMALHFLDRHQVMCLRIGSKWELRRLCQAVGATALVRLGPPTPDEMGYCDSARVQEMGGKPVTIFTNAESKLATIVLRASTTSVLNDLERAVDDGVQAVAQAAKDGRFVYGGGAVEMALSVALQQEAEKVPGLEQYALAAFGKALEVIPRTLAENAGWDSTRVLADLQSSHASVTEGTICDVGVDIDRLGDDQGSGTTSMKEKAIYDLLNTKMSALRQAVDATVTILKVDQIIMSKPSGGPKM
ncbi:T-complex protein 1 subunit theta [Fistulifera solaris]|uniref:T-complex protein 1 subunit theta n=1 Tax=Fistulifera solaris TaxID=1519565 RepID=A0A1Z5J5G1_FISSO|nr:T-complex protein 1 subunit theta [Fistulifera solaris]|eukprot:GAX09235.1 T-complex protein 1 subunit theta [Fistulifera solaris]